ncbi:MAG: FHA domain-containing protein, partial [Kofleriaceae bacterium]
AWIGRAPDAPVRIDALPVNRRHVELGVDSHEGWFARDAASTHGFYIAAERAGGQRHPLHAGMALQLGGDATVVVLAVHS